MSLEPAFLPEPKQSVSYLQRAKEKGSGSEYRVSVCSV